MKVFVHSEGNTRVKNKNTDEDQQEESNNLRQIRLRTLLAHAEHRGKGSHVLGEALLFEVPAAHTSTQWNKVIKFY